MNYKNTFIVLSTNLKLFFRAVKAVCEKDGATFILSGTQSSGLINLIRFKLIILRGNKQCDVMNTSCSSPALDKSWKCLIPRLRIMCGLNCQPDTFFDACKLTVFAKFSTIQNDTDFILRLCFEFFSCKRVPVEATTSGPGCKAMEENLVAGGFFIPCVYNFDSKKLVDASLDCFHVNVAEGGAYTVADDNESTLFTYYDY